MPPIPEKIHDAAIIGAGPAGATAARALSHAGLSTIILEKSTPPRYKTCGGGILARALNLINDTPQTIAEHTCSTVQFTLSPKLQFTVTRPHPIIYMTMRADFDNWLTQKALAAGATLSANHTVKSIFHEPDHIRITTTQGDIRARYIIAADGAASAVARLAGYAPHRHVVPAVECEVTVCPEDFARLSNSARFDFHVIPQGYAWVFPKKSHLSIGVLSHDPAINLNTAFNSYLSHLNITPTTLTRHGYIIPIHPRHRTLARSRIFLIGDAAGLADPVTAEGITPAIQSGLLAAESITHHLSNDAQACQAYNTAIAKTILPNLRHARRLATLLYKLPRTRNTLFHLRGPALIEAMTQIVTGHATYTSILNNPANYLKLITRVGWPEYQAVPGN